MAKNSRSRTAPPPDLSDPLAALNAAAQRLGLPPQADNLADAIAGWTRAWANLYNPAS